MKGCTAKQTKDGRREESDKYGTVGPRYVLVSLEVGITERMQEIRKQDGCVEMGVDVDWFRHLNAEYV